MLVDSIHGLDILKLTFKSHQPMDTLFDTDDLYNFKRLRVAGMERYHDKRFFHSGKIHVEHEMSIPWQTWYITSSV